MSIFEKSQTFTNLPREIEKKDAFFDCFFHEKLILWATKVPK